MRRTREDIIDRLCNNAGMKRKDAERALHEALMGISDMMRDGDDLSLYQFGIFKPRHIAEREYQVPGSDGKKTIVPAHVEVKFYMSDSLKRYVNEDISDE